MNEKDSVTCAVVLVVEDEALLRLDAFDTLDRAGFEVCEAASASEALVVLDRRHDVAVVVTDLEMPGPLNGLDLARQVRKTWPEVAVVIVSGCMRPQPGEIPQEVEFLSKPYRTSTLITRVREAAEKK
jgi:DNA-binding NtrC family response regulator